MAKRADWYHNYDQAQSEGEGESEDQDEGNGEGDLERVAPPKMR
jgi:hypothetical protein